MGPRAAWRCVGGGPRARNFMRPLIPASSDSRGTAPALQMEKPRSQRGDGLPKDPMTKTRQGWDFKVASLSYLKGKLSAPQCDSLFPHVPSALRVPLPPRCGVPHRSWALGGTGRGRAVKEATEKEHAWAGGHVHSQPGPGCVQPKLGAGKLLLFTRQLCRSRR